MSVREVNNGAQKSGTNTSMGLIAKIQVHLPFSCLSLSGQGQTMLSVLVSTLLWLSQAAALLPPLDVRAARTHHHQSLGDVLQHWQDRLSTQAVYHRGCYFRLWVYKAGRLLSPREIEYQIQRILDDPSSPVPGEDRLGALTAGDRVPWGTVRKQYFSSGVNKRPLDCIERAAAFVTLDDEEQGMMGEDPVGNLNRYANSLLHGKCYDRGVWY
ncbi:carnitine O-palmitoyltransferase 1, liver isoform-like [Oncorhynchus kisutch]|uniref:carnitine O-palmitoyltransferase 1, liver isoform-like n=1 Tax=Oncorhynchus kisutch TaxID=8019 RepID=UPI00099FFC96|nr:carnitine O-palmitoyltransferase 1, liver isoform-like [Oncorhynchus kisutch]